MAGNFAGGTRNEMVCYPTSAYGTARWCIDDVDVQFYGDQGHDNDIPIPVYNSGAVPNRDRYLYQVGGANSDNLAVNNLQLLDDEVGTWTAKTGMPIPSVGLGVAIAGDKIYAIGGSPDDGSIGFNYTQVYSIPDDSGWNFSGN